MKKLTFQNKGAFALHLLEKELEIIHKDQQTQYIGGSSGYSSDGYSSSGGGAYSMGAVTAYLSQFFGQTVHSSVDGNGNWVISVGSSGWIPLSFQLDEVTITAGGGVMNSSGYSYYGDWGGWLGNYYSSGFFDFSNYGGGGSGNSTPILPENMVETEYIGDFIANAEGLQNTIYVDSAGHQTIGYGHKLTQQEINDGTYENRTLTAAEALALLRTDMQTAVSSVQRNIRVPLTQYQFDALVSFTFQQGSSGFANSTVNTMINNGDYTGAAEALRNYSNSSGDGRVHRRNEEADLFSRGDYFFNPY